MTIAPPAAPLSLLTAGRLPRVAGRIALAGLVALLVLPCLIGSLSSVLALAAALALTPLLRHEDWRAIVTAEGAVVVFLIVFVALMAVFSVTARSLMDLIYASNFLALVLAAPVAVAAHAWRGRQLGLLVCVLSLAGVAVGVLTGVFDLTVRQLDRAQGFIGNSNLLPRVAVLLGFIALGGVLLTTARWRIVFYLGPVLALIALYLAQSRGAALVFPALAVSALVFIAVSRANRRHLIALIVALGIGAAALLATGAFQASRFMGIGGIVTEVLGTGATEDFAAEQRVIMYRAGIKAFSTSPWVGYGWANLGNAAAEADPINLGKSAGTRDMFHSDLINFAVAGGIVGILGWLSLVFAPLAGALRASRDDLSLARLYFAATLTLSVAVGGATDFVLGYDLHTTLFAFLTAGLLAGVRSPDPREATR